MLKVKNKITLQIGSSVASLLEHMYGNTGEICGEIDKKNVLVCWHGYGGMVKEDINNLYISNRDIRKNLDFRRKSNIFKKNKKL